MKTITESEHRRLKEQYRKAVDDLNKIGDREIARAGITYPPDLLPSADDPDTAEVIVIDYTNGIPFQ